MNLYIVFLTLFSLVQVRCNDHSVYYSSDDNDILVQIEENGDCSFIGDRDLITRKLENVPDDDTVRNVTLDEIQSIIANCPKNGTLSRQKRADNEILHFIFPGTKFCGAGNISAYFDDVGELKETDLCCRTHDMCPVNVAGFSTEHDMTNVSPFTRSHCACDRDFHDCLKESGDDAANTIGDIYFNVLKVDCIEEVSKVVCIEESENDECIKYGIEVEREFVPNLEY